MDPFIVLTPWTNKIQYQQQDCNRLLRLLSIKLDSVPSLIWFPQSADWLSILNNMLISGFANNESLIKLQNSNIMLSHPHFCSFSESYLAVKGAALILPQSECPRAITRASHGGKSNNKSCTWEVKKKNLTKSRLSPNLFQKLFLSLRK